MTLEEKKVSVIIPVYNSEKYLDRCINSLVTQTYKNIELIIIDDKSPDNAPKICDSWAKRDSRIKVIHNEVNEGVAAARNKGISYITGDYVAFVDSDDFTDKTLIEKAVSRLDQENADIVWYGFNFYFGEDRVFPYSMHVKKEVYTGKEIQDRLIPDILEGSRNGKVKGLCGAVWTYIVSVDFLKQNAPEYWSEREWYLEDVLFNYIMYSKLNKVVIIPEYLYYWNQTNTSSLTSKKISLDQYVKLRKLIQYMLDNRKKLGYTTEMDLRIQDFFVYLTIREMIQLAVNKSYYDEVTFQIIMEHMICDKFFHRCLAFREINENWSDDIRRILQMILMNRYDECIKFVVNMVQENKAAVLKLFLGESEDNLKTKPQHHSDMWVIQLDLRQVV